MYIVLFNVPDTTRVLSGDNATENPFANPFAGQ
jgi:hypothetical protein